MAVLVILLCGMLATAVNQVASAAPRPNVLFMVVDDLRPMLGCYGEKHMVTPNIDNLASKSVRFEHAYVQQAVCSPSRTSFLTGRRPDTTRIFDLVHYFRKVSGNYTTLPQHFKNNGYITQSSGKIFHPGTASGGTDDYPYSWTNPAFHAPTESNRKEKVCEAPDGTLQAAAYCPVDVKNIPGGSLPDIQNADFTIEFLKNRSLDHQPFFMGMGFHKPHLPFKFPREFLDLYRMDQIELAPNPYYPPWLPTVAWSSYGELKQYDDVAAFNISTFGLVPTKYQYRLRLGYKAAATYTDAQIGRVLQALDQYGLSDNTIISLHGDHGWQLGDHGEWCKHTNFDIATRIPMMIHVPGVTSQKPPAGGGQMNMFPFHDVLAKKKKKTSAPEPEEEDEADPKGGAARVAVVGPSSDALVEAVDLYATLSELAGLAVPDTCPPDPFHVPFCTEGSSLVPLIKNATAAAAMTSYDRDVTSAAAGGGGGGRGGGSLTSWKRAVFSQYPRSALYPGGKKTPIMGYTMRTAAQRYTEWLAYNHTSFTADWSTVYARELYIYSSDPDEDLDVAAVPAFQDLVSSLSAQLRAGWRKALPGTGL